MKQTNGTSELRSLVERLDPFCKQLVSSGAERAYRDGHAALDIEHVLASLFAAGESVVLERLVAAGLDLLVARKQMDRLLATAKLSGGLPPALSSRLVGVLRDAWMMVSLNNRGDSVDVDTLMAAIGADTALYAQLCDAAPSLHQFSLARFLDAGLNAAEVSDADGESAVGSALTRFTVDLTARASAGTIDPVIGREREIAQLIEILLRRRQNNPILTGEAGVGKTAIVEGLAQRIAAGTVPDALRNVVIRCLDMGLLKAGSGVRGEIESRLKSIIAEVATAVRPIILFIDEAHTLVGGVGGGGDHNDLANLIKPELARGTLRTIAATTWSEYKRYFEKDAALSRRFQVVRAEEPSPHETQQILMSLVPALQKHHGVYVMQGALEAAVDLSTRYLQGRQQPDKAISVLDTACARAVAGLTGPAATVVALQQKEALWTAKLAAVECEAEWGGADERSVSLARGELEALREARQALKTAAGNGEALPAGEVASVGPQARVGVQEVASVVADWTGVPSSQMLADRSAAVMALEQVLQERVVGQPRAIKTIARRISAYATGMADANRPIGVFLLVGPSGVGKTETAHALASAFFGGDNCMTVVNMSEYQEAHTVSKLKGAPPGYVGFGQGGVLTEAIRRRPYGVLLLDEIEKAHPDVIDLFLQVFDKGFLEDSEGVRVDFKNTLIMLTSNACSELFDDADRDEAQFLSFEDGLRDRLAAHFRAAFLGRVHLVPYMPLRKADVARIVDLKLDAVRQRFCASYDAGMEFPADFLAAVVERSANSMIGARFIEQFVAENVLSAVSLHILERLATRQVVGSVRLRLKNGKVLVEAARAKRK